MAREPARAPGQEEDIAAAVDLTPIREPRDGTPQLITDRARLRAYAQALYEGSGPVAVDAERASSFRYGHNAYLVQVRREGAGTGLIDPIALHGDLQEVGAALSGVEWVLHAADQDLPSLAEVGMVPDRLFDTELAARLLGRARVGLGAVVAAELGLELAKEHSAADWSTRPLPAAWLNYAALDVELLIPVRDALAQALVAAGKAEWARQEFEYARTRPPRPAPIDPWRRLPRLSASVRSARGLAAARELWDARDELARRTDVSPSRVLSSAAIVAAAKAMPRTAAGLAGLPEFSGRGTRARIDHWFAALERARSLPEDQLPSRRPQCAPGSIPQSRSWRTVRPVAQSRLEDVRAQVRALAEARAVPQENLLQPAAQKALAWQAAESGTLTAQQVVDLLRSRGARPWQISIVTEPLARVLSRPTAPTALRE